MKYLILFYLFLWASKTIAQQNTFTFPAKLDSMLTNVERDSFKRGLIPHTLNIQFEKMRREYIQKQSVFLKENIGAPVPNFEAVDTTGFTHRPSNYHGRVWLIHFWHFWDYSFQNEIPRLNEIIEKYGKDGVKVLSFTDLTLGNAEKKYLTEHPIYFPIVENAHKFSDDFLSFPLGLPYIVFVDKSGRIRHFITSNELNVVRSNVNEKVASKDAKPLPYNLEEKIIELLKE